MVEMLSHKMRKLPAPTKKIKGTKLDQFTPLVDHIAVSKPSILCVPYCALYQMPLLLLVYIYVCLGSCGVGIQ